MLTLFFYISFTESINRIHFLPRFDESFPFSPFPPICVVLSLSSLRGLSSQTVIVMAVVVKINVTLFLLNRIEDKKKMLKKKKK